MRVTNDRRRKPRVRLAGAAVVHGGTSPITCECIDLAIGGVGLRSPTKIKKGRQVGVLLSLGDRSVTVHAVVKRCRAKNKQWVLGLQFTGLDAPSAKLVEAFVEDAMHRDVRLYRAQVFLARTGARSLEDVLGTKGPLPGAPVEPAPVEAAFDDAEGSAPITLDELVGPITHTQPWAPVPPPAASAVVPETSADLRHAVATALHDLSSELAPSHDAAPRPVGGDFGDAPSKGGTMLRPNPLYQPAAQYKADVSALEYDDAHGSDGQPGRRTTVVDPRTLAERSQGVRPPPLRIDRAAADAAAFQPQIADLDLDDAPTRMFGDPAPPLPSHIPPSPFGGGHVRTVVPPLPSATSTLVTQRGSVDAPTPVPIPGRDDVRIPEPTAQSGATQVAIPAARTMPYGPVRGESTQVTMPAQVMPRPLPRPSRPSTGRSGNARRNDAAIDDADTRLRAHPMQPSEAGADAARTQPGHEEDTELAAQYSRALTDLDLDSR